MITFIIKGEDQKLFKWFWMPFQAKYPEYQYLVVSEKQFKQAITKAAHDTIFITDIDAIPTYETMVLLENIGGKNQVILPKWYEGYGNPSKDLNTFSVLKEKFVSAGYDLEEYIEKWTPIIHKKGSMYYVK